MKVHERGSKIGSHQEFEPTIQPQEQSAINAPNEDESLALD